MDHFWGGFEKRAEFCPGATGWDGKPTNCKCHPPNEDKEETPKKIDWNERINRMCERKGITREEFDKKLRDEYGI